MPSYYEAYYMCVNLHFVGLGDFVNDWYWTSSEFDANEAYMMDFNFAVGSPLYKGAPDVRIRACRQFTTDTVYNIGDEGPGGGWIFYSQASANPDYYDYWEAAPSDLSSNEWSDVTNTLIGTTGVTVGEGYPNSLLIVRQSGHTDSAAEDCLESDYPYHTPSSSPSSSAS